MAVLDKTYEADNRTGINHEGAAANTPVSRLTARTIIGDSVINRMGEHLGVIDDIMLDVQTGKIEYVVLEVGALLGMGGKLFAIPYQDLSLNAEGHCFVLDKGKEELKKFPGFDKNHWPDTNDHYYVKVDPLRKMTPPTIHTL
jgi:sporulation protein YlmC with PRC-barrel domain